MSVTWSVLLFVAIVLSLVADVSGFREGRLLKAQCFHSKVQLESFQNDVSGHISRLKMPIVAMGLEIMSLLVLPAIAMARPEGINRPDLLPNEQTTVIDTANFLR